MTRSSPQPNPDDLDRAFSQYFRTQLPGRFPAAPIPTDTAPPPAPHGGPWRTRLTLAASVAAVLALGLAVSYGPGANRRITPDGGGFDPNAVVGDGKGLQKHLPDAPPMGMVP
ncbi:MAG: hypothetical protein MUF18_03825 [Fimbriiglobus sp.]|nr:hypothetical protein [Fimbriiglobus sp.]